MTRELLILRHGKSDWETGDDDFHRPLTERGRRSAERMAIWMLEQKLMPDYVVASPAERALTTAQKACKTMGVRRQEIHKDPRVYAAALEELLRVLADCPGTAKRVMLVGHNPGLEDLLTYLADKPIPLPEDGKLLPTATLARLRMPDDWKKLPQGCARLESITRPGALPDTSSLPAQGHSEPRDRPAYYYSQSSVIPYRIREGKLEILVISSIRRKHWIVPKGIKEPGMSPQESAAREAREEAGVEGRVADASIGTYTYEKWGGTCTVDVYAMEVTRVLPDEEWEERHRGREWVSPKQAAKRLKQDELKSMLDTLVTLLHAT
jgi:phosphohistidine phosphatase